jgi:CxxC-x17-CxxC domain-containing protein
MAFSRGGFRRGGGGGGFRRFGPREMHKITCSECGKEGEVPFKPKEGLPVLCKECFMKKKGITPREQKPQAEESEEAEEAEEEPVEESEE